jgi:hypothetical protein
MMVFAMVLSSQRKITMHPSFKRSWTVILALALGAIGVTTAHGTPFTVSNLNDSGAGSLRQAITDANAAVTSDTISFSVSGTITLASTLPTITDAAGLTIDGAGQTLTISGNNAVRVMQVAVNASLTVKNLTIANGAVAGDLGGGIGNSGTTTIVNSTLSGNSAPSGFGGGIYNAANGTLTVTNSTFSGNSTTSGFGGGIYNNGTTVNVTNSTFSGNAANLGVGAAIYNNSVAGVTLRNTIVANSVGAGNCGGAITNGGNNIDSAATCAWGSTNGSMSSTNPQLAALASNGGPTQTLALLSNSPAINAVTFSAPNGAPSTDQRGTARPQGAGYDIGAFEFIPLALVNAVSRRVHGGAGTFDLPLSPVTTNPSTEPRQGPAQSIVFTFDKPISAATATITEGVATAAPPTFSGNSVIVSLTGVNNQQYVTIALTNVGSPDGSTGGSASVRLGFLVGDVNQNRVVTLSDLGLVNAELAQSVTGVNYLKDVNASGTMTLADKGVTNANLTKALPAP